MPSPGSRRRGQRVAQSEPVFGGCLTYLACLTTLIVLSVAAGGASYALLMAGAPAMSQGLAIGVSIVVVIGVALWLNWLLRRWIGHSITDFLDLLDLF